jgi:hypothetical protein
MSAHGITVIIIEKRPEKSIFPAKSGESKNPREDQNPRFHHHYRIGW